MTSIETIKIPLLSRPTLLLLTLPTTIIRCKPVRTKQVDCNYQQTIFIRRTVQSFGISKAIFGLRRRSRIYSRQLSNPHLDGTEKINHRHSEQEVPRYPY